MGYVQQKGVEDKEDKLTLSNVGGAFIVLAAGIGVAFVFAFIEFLWNVKTISVEEHVRIIRLKSFIHAKTLTFR